jgi:pimeloyl-ACP methyl ester carboxylesterase
MLPSLRTAVPRRRVLPRCILSALAGLLLPARLLAQEETGWQASPEIIERWSKTRKGLNFEEDRVPAYVLPDALTTLTGKKVTHMEEWWTMRRPEVLELCTKEIYGRVPKTPYEQTFEVLREDRNALGGAATLKRVGITIRSGGKSLTIHLTLYTPNRAAGAAPVFLLIDQRRPPITDPTILKTEFWPAEQIVARGYGAAIFSNADVDPDNFDNFKNGIHGLLDRGERPADAWATIAAWAWGASRCLDYLVTDRDVARDKVAIVGHSRGGKTALWAGATDPRFALVVSNDSGCTGATLSRRRLGETVEVINKNFPHWFCTNYKKYGQDVNMLPVDQHMVLALIAPRPLYVVSADDYLWADPKGQYLALFHALPVYRLLGNEARIPEGMPPMNEPVTSANVGYHIRDGKHDVLLKDWNWFMDFADKVWQ